MKSILIGLVLGSFGFVAAAQEPQGALVEPGTQPTASSLANTPATIPALPEQEARAAQRPTIIWVDVAQPDTPRTAPAVVSTFASTAMDNDQRAMRHGYGFGHPRT